MSTKDFEGNEAGAAGTSSTEGYPELIRHPESCFDPVVSDFAANPDSTRQNPKNQFFVRFVPLRTLRGNLLGSFEGNGILIEESNADA